MKKLVLGQGAQGERMSRKEWLMVQGVKSEAQLSQMMIGL